MGFDAYEPVVIYGYVFKGLQELLEYLPELAEPILGTLSTNKIECTWEDLPKLECFYNLDPDYSCDLSLRDLLTQAFEEFNRNRSVQLQVLYQEVFTDPEGYLLFLIGDWKESIDPNEVSTWLSQVDKELDRIELKRSIRPTLTAANR